MSTEKFLDLLREMKQAAEAQDKVAGSDSVTVERQFVTKYTEDDLSIIITSGEDKGVVAVEIDSGNKEYSYVFTDEDANKFLSVMRRVMAAITYRG